MGAWIAVSTTAMAQTIGVVIDDTLESAIVFDGDSLAILGPWCCRAGRRPSVTS
jgi:hypothetical protein